MEEVAAPRVEAAAAGVEQSPRETQEPSPALEEATRGQRQETENAQGEVGAQDFQGELALEAELQARARAEAGAEAQGGIRGTAIRVSCHGTDVDAEGNEIFFVDVANDLLGWFWGRGREDLLLEQPAVQYFYRGITLIWAVIVHLVRRHRFREDAQVHFQKCIDLILMPHTGVRPVAERLLRSSEQGTLERQLRRLKEDSKRLFAAYTETLHKAIEQLLHPDPGVHGLLHWHVQALDEYFAPPRVEHVPVEYWRLPQFGPDDSVDVHLVIDGEEGSQVVSVHRDSTAGDLKWILVHVAGLPAALRLARERNGTVHALDEEAMLETVGNPVVVKGVASLRYHVVEIREHASMMDTWHVEEWPLRKVDVQSASKMMVDLRELYADSDFQHRYNERRKCYRHVAVALDVQVSVLPKFGFQGSPNGVREMRNSVEDLAKADPPLKKVQQDIWRLLQFREALPPCLAEKGWGQRTTAWYDWTVLGPNRMCNWPECTFRIPRGRDYCCKACKLCRRSLAASKAAAGIVCEADGHDAHCTRLSAYTLFTSFWESCRIDVSAEEVCHCLVVPPLGFKDATAPRPVLLFLAGAGHVDDKGDLLEGGPDLLLRNPAVRKDFIVVAPKPTSRCGLLKPGERGKQAWSEDGVWAIFTEVLRRLGPEKADPSRLYLTGISMGASGVWRLLSKYGSVFAAAAPVSGPAEWPGGSWPSRSGPSQTVLDILHHLPVRAYEIDNGKDSTSPQRDITWLSWGLMESRRELQLRGVDPGSTLTAKVREWHPSQEDVDAAAGSLWLELWTVPGPLKDSASMNSAWGGDTHCLWFRVYPFLEWDLADFFLRHTCSPERQWSFKDKPLVLDTAAERAMWTHEDWNQILGTREVEKGACSLRQQPPWWKPSLQAEAESSLCN